MNDELSIDGLGLTFGDLSEAGQRKAVFILLKRNQLSEALVLRLTAQTAATKEQADQAQAAFDRVGR